MNRHLPRKNKVTDKTAEQLVHQAPVRAAPVLAGYSTYAADRPDEILRSVYLYFDGGILEHNPFLLDDPQQLSKRAVNELAIRARRVAKIPHDINEEICIFCGGQLQYCRCWIEEKENANF